MKPFLFLTSVIFLIFSGCQPYHQKNAEDLHLKSYAIKSNHYPAPTDGDDIIGHAFAVRTKPGESLQTIAKRYDVGITEMMDANPQMKPHKMLPGTIVIVPTQYILPPKKYRQGIVINVAEMRLYYFSPIDGTISTYPVALGREKWRTPLGKTTVIRKQESPTWYVPKSIQAEAKKKGEILPNVVPPGPNNPLGPYAIYLGMDGYLIHGTTSPNSIGRLVSSGCIRMYNKDVTDLFAKVDKGTPVNIIYYPNKVGWKGNRLFLEAHKPIRDENGSYRDVPITVAIEETAAEKPNTVIDWGKVHKVVGRHSGAPTVIGHS